MVSPGIERVLAMLAQQAPRADILEPFVVAAREVPAQELGMDVTPGKLSLASGAAPTLEVTVVMGITGHATTLLAGLGLTCEVSAPMLLVGAGSRLSTASIKRLVIPLGTEVGTMQAQVAIKVTGAKTV